MVETSELVHYKSRFFDPKTLIIAVSQSGKAPRWSDRRRPTTSDHGYCGHQHSRQRACQKRSMPPCSRMPERILGVLQDLCHGAYGAEVAECRPV